MEHHGLGIRPDHNNLGKLEVVVIRAGDLEADHRIVADVETIAQALAAMLVLVALVAKNVPAIVQPQIPLDVARLIVVVDAKRIVQINALMGAPAAIVHVREAVLDIRRVTAVTALDAVVNAVIALMETETEDKPDAQIAVVSAH